MASIILIRCYYITSWPRGEIYLKFILVELQVSRGTGTITHLMIYTPHIRLVASRLQGMKQRELGRQK